MQKQRINNIEVKKINRNQIYRFINFNERVSKTEIASALGVSMPTVLKNVSELLDCGLISEIGVFKSTGGRKARVLSPEYNTRFAIGIDITQNHFGMALTNLSGKLLSHKRLYIPYANDDQYYRELGDLALNFLKESGRPENQFLGFGFSIPGIVSQDNSAITYSHTLKITNISTKILTQYIPFTCIFTNDANAAMIAEMFLHSNKSTSVYLSLSNSVGGAIYSKKSSEFKRSQVFENHFLGDHCRSGEFGHMTLVPGGDTCYCGKRGCINSYCSAKVLSQHSEGMLSRFFAELNQNPAFENILECYLDNLAIVVNTLRMTFDCKIIIGGCVGSYIGPYMETLKKRAALLNAFETDASYIETCQFKNESSAYGAALLNIESFLQEI